MDSLRTVAKRKFYLIAEHQALVSILDQQTLDCVQNTRIQNLKAATGSYNFRTIWRKGKESDAIYNQTCMVNAIALTIENDIDDLPDGARADRFIEEIRTSGKNDEEYKKLLKYLKLDSSCVNDQIVMYKSVLDEISEEDGILLMRQRLIIPKTLRKDIMRKLHTSHQGVDQTLRRACETVYWPGLTSDIKNNVRACELCLRYCPSQAKETMGSDPLATRIFEEVAAG